MTEKVNIVVLCDGNNKIGAGHFFRCLAIAKELVNRSVFVVFFIPSTDLQSFAESVGIAYKILPELFKSDQSEEYILTELKAVECNIVLVDSHRATYNLLSKLHERYLTVYIDDLLMYPYPVDVLVNVHIDISGADYLALYLNSTIPVPQILIGGKYFPMKAQPTQTKQYSEEKHVAFFAGGSDPDHVTIRMLRYLLEQRIPIPYTFHIVVGMMNQDYEEIKYYCDLEPNIYLHYGITNLTVIYGKIDLAISAAGVTLYELAYCGVPTIVYSMVDNQIHTAEAFYRLNISVYIGDSRSDPIFLRMFKTVSKLIEDVDKLNVLSENGKRFIDGLGGKRIANFMLEQKAIIKCIENYS